MNHIEAAPKRAEYLRRLDAAIAPLPHGVAAEIRAGVAEELAGLEGDALIARIAELGDPEQIAREARQELPDGATPVAPAPPPAVAPAPAPSAPVTTTRGFAIGAALTLGFGGLLVPGAGWVVGAVLVLLSTMWRGWEKAVAILVPLAGGLLSMVTASFMWVGSGSWSQSSGFGAAEVVNPLVPDWYSVLWMIAMVVGLLLIPASGLIGAIVVILADALLRAIIGAEGAIAVPTGVATTVLGAIVLVVMARRLRDSGPTRRPPSIRFGVRSDRRFWVVLIVTGAAVGAVVLIGMLVGSTQLLTGDIALWLQVQAPPRIAFALDERAPRVIAAVAAGAG